MAVETLDKSGSCWDIHQDGTWLSADGAAVLDGVRGNSASQGRNDACMAALLADPECHDTCVVASHLNPSASGRGWFRATMRIGGLARGPDFVVK